MKMFTNLILFIMLLSITVILLSGCSIKRDKKVPNIPFSIVKKMLIGID